MNCPRKDCGGLLTELEGAYKYKCTACARYFKDLPKQERETKAVTVHRSAEPAATRTKTNGHDVTKALADYIKQIDLDIERLQQKKDVLQEALEVVEKP